MADVVRLCGEIFVRNHALSFEQAPVLRDVRGVPHAVARRPPRRVRGVRTEPPLVQLVPQPALSEVPGASAGALGARTRATRVADSSLPRRLHTALAASRGGPSAPATHVRS